MIAESHLFALLCRGRFEAYGAKLPAAIVLEKGLVGIPEASFGVAVNYVSWIEIDAVNLAIELNATRGANRVRITDVNAAD